MGVSLGRLSGSALGSNFADLLTSERGVGGWQHRSALSQSRACCSCVFRLLSCTPNTHHVFCVATVYSTVTVLYG